MEGKMQKERIRAVPRQGVVLTAAAVLMALGPVVDWLLGHTDGYYAAFSLLPCLVAAAGAVLLLAVKNNVAVRAAAGGLLLFFTAALLDQMLGLIACAAWIVSSAGMSWNRVPGFLPAKLRMPVLNLVGGVIVILSLLLRLTASASLHLLPAFLSVAGALLLLGNVDAEAIAPSTPEDRAGRGPRLRYQSVPAGALAAAGAVVLVLSGGWRLVDLVRLLGAFDVPLTNFLWPLLILAAGVVLLMRSQGEKRMLPAVILLLICQFRSLYAARQVVLFSSEMDLAMEQTQRAALLFFSVLLLLIGVIGATWNRPVGRAHPRPLLNVITAALAALNGIWTLVYQIDQLGYTEDTAVQILSVLQSLLVPAGLVLVSLGMECRAAEPAARKVDGEKYRRGLSGFVSGFYSDVGGKLQLLAKIGGAICLILGLLGVLCALLSLLLLLLQLVGLIPPYFSPWTLLLSGAICVVSALLLAVGTWPLYAFGQITRDLHDIRGSGIPSAAPREEASSASRPEDDNPDQLPEL